MHVVFVNECTLSLSLSVILISLYLELTCLSQSLTQELYRTHFPMVTSTPLFLLLTLTANSFVGRRVFYNILLNKHEAGFNIYTLYLYHNLRMYCFDISFNFNIEKAQCGCCWAQFPPFGHGWNFQFLIFLNIVYVHTEFMVLISFGFIQMVAQHFCTLLKISHINYILNYFCIRMESSHFAFPYGLLYHGTEPL